MRALLPATLLTLTLATGAAGAAELRYGLSDDADALDPALNRSSTAMTVMGALCDRLVQLDQAMVIQPMLATSWSWSADNKVLTFDLRKGVRFHDGTILDAAAVKANFDRDMTLSGTQRRDDTASIDHVDTVGDSQVAIHLKTPYTALLAKIADRIGMIGSPAAYQAAGANFGRHPVCAGPFRFVERVAQDHIVVERFPDYWDPPAVHLDRITFRVIPDNTVRLANLQAGDLDIIERLDPSDVPRVKADPKLRLLTLDPLNYQSIIFNLAKTARADTPFGRDPKAREAFDLALDRDAINQVAFGGVYLPGNQPAPPGSRYYDPDLPVPPRDVAKAKQILADAGYKGPIGFELLVPNRPLSIRVAEMIQAMAGEAGIQVKLRVVDFATSLNMTESGDFQAWGPIGPQNANDPDGITFMSLHSIGSRNVGKYANPEMDRLMAATRTEPDPDRRAALFKQVAQVIGRDRAVIYLYHQRTLFAMSARLHDVTATGDGYLRFQGLTLQ